MFNKICDFFTNLLLLWVLLLCFLGFIKPSYLIILKPYLDYLFMFTMLGIGFVLNYEDFIPVLKKPHLVLLGTLAQFIIMPFLGWFFAILLKLPKELAVGLILTGSAPGAMASNVISYLANADVAYSIALTTLSTFLAPVLTPAFTSFYAKAFIDIKFLPMFLSIIKMVILPLLLGLVVKHFMREKIEKIKSFFPAFSTLFIAFICGLVVALNKNYLEKVNIIIFVAVALHNFFGLLLGYLFGILYGFDKKRKRTLSLEVGMQNAGLGAVLALKHISAQAALPNALFAVWCILTATILAQIWHKDQ